MADKTILKFNPEGMTVKDLKICAETLRGLLADFDKFPDNWQEVGCRVAQFRNAFVIEK